MKRILSLFADMDPRTRAEWCVYLAVAFSAWWGIR